MQINEIIVYNHAHKIITTPTIPRGAGLGIPAGFITMKRRLGPSRSPIVSATVNRFSQHQRARSALKWGAVSSVAMVLVLADM